MTVCRLCRKNKSLIKAHIYPKKLYEPIKRTQSKASSSNRSPAIHYPGTDRQPKLIQSGIHDSSILCGDCDNKVIGPWDNYAQTLLRSLDSQKKGSAPRGDRRNVLTIESFDYRKLKLFFISILWRAVISEDEFFKRIESGPWEQKLRRMILRQDPGTKDEFATVVMKYEGPYSTMMSQAREVKGLPGVYLFRFPNYGFMIKANQNIPFFPRDEFVVSPEQPLVIPIEEYIESQKVSI